MKRLALLLFLFITLSAKAQDVGREIREPKLNRTYSQRIDELNTIKFKPLGLPEFNLKIRTPDILGLSDTLGTYARTSKITPIVTTFSDFTGVTANSVVYDGSVWKKVTGVSSTTATGYGTIQTATIAGSYYYKRDLSGGVVNLSWFKPKGDGVTSDYRALQTAINAVSRGATDAPKGGIIIMPTGTYLIDTTLNMANTRIPGTMSRDGITLKGEGMNYTTLLGKTGNGKAVLDITGSQWLTLSDFTINTNGSTGSSTIGIYSGLGSANPQTQNQTLNRISIFMHDDTTANANNGTVAYYNFGSEENTLNTVYFVGNRAAVFTAYADRPYNYPYSFFALAPSHSLGVTTLIGECFFEAITKKFGGMELVDVNSMSAENLYLYGSGNGKEKAIVVHGQATNIKLHGTIEGWGGILHNYGRLVNSQISYTVGNTNETTTALVKLDRGEEGAILGSNIELYLTANTGRTFWDLTPLSSNEIVPSYVKNSTVRANMSLPKMMLPEKAIFNAKTSGVLIQSDSLPEYRIDAKQQSILIGQTMIRGFSGSSLSAVVASVKMPTVISGTSATSVRVTLTGTLAHAFPSGNSSTVMDFTANLPIVMNQVGTITIGDGIGQVGTHAEANAGGNTITGCTITGTVSGNNVSIVLTPSVSGANNEAVYFSGRVTLSWMGHTCNAPSLTF